MGNDLGGEALPMCHIEIFSHLEAAGPADAFPKPPGGERVRVSLLPLEGVALRHVLSCSRVTGKRPTVSSKCWGITCVYSQ